MFKKKKKRKTIILDFDGTIVDSLPLIFKITNEVLKSYGDEELPPSKIEKLKREGVKNALSELNLSIFSFSFLILKIQFRLYNRVDEIELFTKMRDSVEKLSKNFQLGILTNNRKKIVNKFLLQNDFNDFNFVKSNFLLRKKSKKLKKINSGDVIAYVGDQKTDMIAAKEVGIQAVGVSWGFDESSELKEGGADFVAEKPEELISFFRRFE